MVKSGTAVSLTVRGVLENFYTFPRTKLRLTDAVQKQQEYQDGQLEWIKTVGMVRSYLESNPNGAVKAQGQHDPEGQS